MKNTDISVLADRISAFIKNNILMLAVVDVLGRYYLPVKDGFPSSIGTSLHKVYEIYDKGILRKIKSTHSETSPLFLTCNPVTPPPSIFKAP